MPLNILALTSSPGLPGAQGGNYPGSRAAAAAHWALAMAAYASAIVPPTTTLPVARIGLEAALLTAFGAVDAAASMETAFAAFAAQLALGMAPAYAAVQPPGDVGFAALFTLPRPSTRQEGVERVANAIDAWMRTGTATLAAPPNTVINWT